MIEVPCGKVQGHGEYCSHDRMCEICRELIRCNATVVYKDKPNVMSADDVFKKWGIAGLIGVGAWKLAEFEPIKFEEDK